MLPSGWQLSQLKVPVVDAPASLKAIRPALTTGSVGSLSAIVVSSAGLDRSESDTTEMLFDAALSTHACRGAPLSSESSAIPRGTASTATRPRTSPLSTSTVESLPELAAVTTSVRSSALISIA